MNFFKCMFYSIYNLKENFTKYLKIKIFKDTN